MRLAWRLEPSSLRRNEVFASASVGKGTIFGKKKRPPSLPRGPLSARPPAIDGLLRCGLVRCGSNSLLHRLGHLLVGLAKQESVVRESSLDSLVSEPLRHEGDVHPIVEQGGRVA